MTDDWSITEEDFDRLEQEALVQASRHRIQQVECSIKNHAPPSFFSSSETVQTTASLPPSLEVVPAHGTSKELKITLKVHSDGRIATRSPFFPKLKDALKRVKGSCWDSESKFWLYPDTQLQSVLDTILNFPGLKVENQIPGLQLPELNLCSSSTGKSSFQEDVQPPEPKQDAGPAPLKEDTSSQHPVEQPCNTGVNASFFKWQENALRPQTIPQHRTLQIRPCSAPNGAVMDCSICITFKELKGFFGLYSGSSHMDELHALLSSTIMIRRLKKDVLPQLPPKHREQVSLMLTEKAMKPVRRLSKQLQEVRKALRATPDMQSEEANQVKLREKALITQLYSETAEAKKDSVIEYLTTLLESKSKFLIFAHHSSMMNEIEKLMTTDVEH